MAAGDPIVVAGAPTAGKGLALDPQGRIPAAVVSRLTRRWASLVTVGPPTNPSDGDIWIAVVDATNGIRWQFQYNAASASAYRWEFIGGAYMTAAVAGNESTTSTSYGDLTTTGPSIVLPRSGDYHLDFYTEINNAVGSFATPKFGSAAAADADRAQIGSGAITGADRMSLSRFGLVKTGLSAADTVKLQYKSVSGGSATYANRTLRLIPIRVS